MYIRTCETCGKELKRGEYESFKNWVKRRTCGRKCGGKITKRKSI